MEKNKQRHKAHKKKHTHKGDKKTNEEYIVDVLHCNYQKLIELKNKSDDLNGIIWNDHQQKQYSDKKTALKITLSGNIEEKIENVRTFRFLSFRFPFELDLAKKSFFLFSESFLSMMIKMVTRWLWCDFFDVFVFGMKNERVFFYWSIRFYKGGMKKYVHKNAIKHWISKNRSIHPEYPKRLVKV